MGKCQRGLPITLYMFKGVKIVMRWSNFPLLIVVFTLALSIIPPDAQGLFFNPEGGFSVGGVHVSVDQDQATISPGDTATFNITIVNDSEFPVLINATCLCLADWKTRLDPGFLLLQPRDIESIHLRITAPDSAKNGTKIEVMVIYAVSFPETGESINVPSTMIHTVVEDKEEKSNLIPLVLAAGILATLLLFLCTDTGKFVGSTALSPLYTRIHKDKVLENSIRNGVFNYIREHPGENFSEIKRKLELNNGVLTHHLKTLEREHYIKSRKDGLYRRFFLRHEPIPNIILNSSQKGILDFLILHPGATQSEVAINLGVSRQTINYHIRAMEEMGAVRIVRNGRTSLCYPAIRPGPAST